MTRQPPPDKVERWLAALDERLRDALADEKVITGHIIQVIAESMVDVAGGKCTLRERGDMLRALRDGMSHLVGMEYAWRLVRRNCLRLLANWDCVAEGVAPEPWRGQPAITEAVVVGLRVMPRERLLLKVNLKTGVCAGITGMTVMPRRVADYFVEHLAGVSSMECATEDISGMRLTATVSESQDGSGLLELRNLDATARQKKLNRELEKSRDERKGCSSQAPCNQCSRTVDQCPLAVFLPEPGGVK